MSSPLSSNGLIACSISSIEVKSKASFTSSAAILGCFSINVNSDSGEKDRCHRTATYRLDEGYEGLVIAEVS